LSKTQKKLHVVFMPVIKREFPPFVAFKDIVYIHVPHCTKRCLRRKKLWWKQFTFCKSRPLLLFTSKIKCSIIAFMRP